MRTESLLTLHRKKKKMEYFRQKFFLKRKLKELKQFVDGEVKRGKKEHSKYTVCRFLPPLRYGNFGIQTLVSRCQRVASAGW